jgi:undecaprenyl diphosphate synthase
MDSLSLGIKNLKSGSIPKHVAIIMDGNGRWALQQGKPRTWGHLHGMNTVRMVVEACVKLEVKVLTLFAFSEENWGRPSEEIKQIFYLLEVYLGKELLNLKKNKVCLKFIGDKQGLPIETQKVAFRGESALQDNQGMILNIALNYSSRKDIVDACRMIVDDVLAGKISRAKIDEQKFSSYLKTSGVCEPDLLIRTSGEQRISNFLLWEMAYTEFYFCEKYWPEFLEKDFLLAIAEYQKRNRRFGLSQAPQNNIERIRQD